MLGYDGASCGPLGLVDLAVATFADRDQVEQHFLADALVVEVVDLDGYRPTIVDFLVGGGPQRTLLTDGLYGGERGNFTAGPAAKRASRGRSREILGRCYAGGPCRRCLLAGLLGGPGWNRTIDRRIMSPLL